MTQEIFFELVYAWKDGDLTGDELYHRVKGIDNDPETDYSDDDLNFTCIPGIFSVKIIRDKKSNTEMKKLIKANDLLKRQVEYHIEANENQSQTMKELKEENNMLYSKILKWYSKVKDDEFADFFNMKLIRNRL